MSDDCACDEFGAGFSDSEMRRARMRQVCGECVQSIPAGRLYFHHWGRNEDGFFWGFDVCRYCDQLWEDLEAAFGETSHEFCRCFGGLQDAVDKALDLGVVHCHTLAEKLIEKSFARSDDLYPCAAFEVERYDDPRQDELQFEAVS